MLFVCNPKILHKHRFQFLLGPINSKEKLKTMLMQKFGLTNKDLYVMLWYFLLWSIVINRFFANKLPVTLTQLGFLTKIAHKKWIY